MAKHILFFSSLFTAIVGGVVYLLKGWWENIVLTMICTSVYKLGANAGCDMLLNLPDYSVIIVLAGIVGVIVSFSLGDNSRV